MNIMREEGDFQEVSQYILKKLEKAAIATLATTGRDMQVSARPMSIINDGWNIYFQTDLRYRKAQQVEENPLVALSFDNIQLEGRVEPQGHSSEPNNQWFCREFKMKHRGSFDKFTMLPHQRIFKVTLSQAACWRYLEGVSYYDTIEFSDSSALREYYEKEKCDK